ncbi:hypothetical protein GCM10023321_30060 [Pseudonocardia eucalypti]|uniref:SnoaL-like domain-containing protein n=1 Tax=Pseudonocardia eucalypti TaxID=648755 RepID=A0ABP9Q3K4_9PSEU|nr:hypothetical protein [Pseudonocardia eucalypti]
MSGGEVLTRLLHAIDVLDWPVVRDCLADRLRVDYTELFGGEAEELSGDQLVTNWRGLLPGFDATQHVTGPVLVTGDGAGPWLDTHVRGYHRIADAPDGPIWAVHGHYRARLDGAGRIADLTLQVFYQEGNAGLVELAGRRATESPRAART